MAAEGRPAQSHSGACRERIDNMVREEGNTRIDRADERLRHNKETGRDNEGDTRGELIHTFDEEEPDGERANKKPRQSEREEQEEEVALDEYESVACHESSRDQYEALSESSGDGEMQGDERQKTNIYNM